MNQIDGFEVKLKCSKHPTLFADYFCADIQNVDYSLICNRCITMKRKNVILIDSKLALSDQDKVILNWPLCENEDIHFQIQDFFSADNQKDNSEAISKIIQKIKQKFEADINKLQKQLIFNNDTANILNQFCQAYDQVSQKSKFQSFLKKELGQNQTFTKLSDQFVSFIKENSSSSNIKLFENTKKTLEQKLQNNTSYEMILKNLENSISQVFSSNLSQCQQQSQLSSQNSEINEKLQQKISQVEQESKQLMQENNSLQSTVNQKTEQVKNREEKIKSLQGQIVQLQSRSQTDNGVIDSLKDELKDSTSIKDVFVQSISKFSDHEHRLVFSDMREFGNAFCCNVCKECLSYSWRCKDCDFDLCFSCAQKSYARQQKQQGRQQIENDYPLFDDVLCTFVKSVKQVPYHEHKLVFTTPNLRLLSILGISQCDQCKTQGVKYTWHCPSCNFDLCVKCTKKIGLN